MRRPLRYWVEGLCFFVAVPILVILGGVLAIGADLYTEIRYQWLTWREKRGWWP